MANFFRTALPNKSCIFLVLILPFHVYAKNLPASELVNANGCKVKTCPGKYDLNFLFDLIKNDIERFQVIKQPSLVNRVKKITEFTKKTVQKGNADKNIELYFFALNYVLENLVNITSDDFKTLSLLKANMLKSAKLFNPFEKGNDPGDFLTAMRLLRIYSNSLDNTIISNYHNQGPIRATLTFAKAVKILKKRNATEKQNKFLKRMYFLFSQFKKEKGPSKRKKILLNLSRLKLALIYPDKFK